MDEETGRPSNGDASTSSAAGKAPRQGRKYWRKDQRNSCKECARLKIKCDRELPCNNCVKRRMPDGVCPDGVYSKSKARSGKENLVQAQESRFSDSPAQAPALPNALPGAASVSTAGSAYRETFGFSQSPADEGDLRALAAVADAAQVPARATDFVGRGAGAVHVYAEESGYATPISSTLNLKYPMMGTHNTDLFALIALLPGRDAGNELIGAYYARVAWMYRPTSPTMIKADFSDMTKPNESYQTMSPPHPHRIASVFMVLALGVIFSIDPLNPGCSVDVSMQQAVDYFNAASLLLTRSGCHFMVRHSLAAVETLHNAVSFCFCTGDAQAGKAAWSLLGMALREGQAIGLHRDSRSMGLTDAEVEMRSRLWWELRTYELLQSLNFGRPYNLPRFSDCPSPVHLPAAEGADTVAAAFHAVKYELASMFGDVSDVLSSAELPAYSACLELDRKLRAVGSRVPASLSPADLGRREPPDSPLVPQRHMVALLLHKALLALHRPFFAKALVSAEPMVSPFAASFSACIISARKHTEILRSLLVQCPVACFGWWFFLFHTTTSAIIQVIVLLRAPNSMLTQDVRGDFESSLNAIVEMSVRSPVARRALPMLLRLRKQVVPAFDDNMPFELQAAAPPAGSGPNTAAFTAQYWNSPHQEQLSISTSMNAYVHQSMMEMDATAPSSPFNFADYGPYDPAALMSSQIPPELTDPSGLEAIDPMLRTLLFWNTSNTEAQG